MTACAPLCGPSAIRKVTSHRSPQMRLCPKRVACVRHPTNSAQPKVAGEPGGRKKCRIKAGGRLRAPLPATPPRNAGRGFSIGGRFYPLLAVPGGRNEEKQRKNRPVSTFSKVAVTGGFQRFSRNQRGGHFSPPGVNSGVSFSSALTATAKLAG